MTLFPARVRIIHLAVCEEPTNSGRIRKRDFVLPAAVYGVGVVGRHFDRFVEKLLCLNAHFAICIRVSPAIPQKSRDTCGRFPS